MPIYRNDPAFLCVKSIVVKRDPDYPSMLALHLIADDGAIERVTIWGAAERCPQFKFDEETFSPSSQVEADAFAAAADRWVKPQEPPAPACVVCGNPFGGYGHNPWPLAEQGRACDACNEKVIAARLKDAFAGVDKLATVRDATRANFSLDKD